jgi:galactokinase
MSSITVAERAHAYFVKCFGKNPAWTAAAPGRVNLIGEHTDYNNGFVLPMAIDRYTVVTGDRNDGRTATLHSVTTGDTVTINLQGPLERGEQGWGNYVRGVIAGFRKTKIKISGFDAVINSTVPLGGGLSSSAALEVAMATFLEAMTGHKLEPLNKALLCQKAEHEYAGVPCGIMDQITSVFAKAKNLLLIDCQSQAVQWVPMKDSSVTVMIINTNVRHKLVESEYAKRRAECETAARQMKVQSLRQVDGATLERNKQQLDPVVYRRARHVITENVRTLRAVEALKKSDWPATGELMYASHDSLRDDYAVSCAELDAVVEIAKSIGSKDGMIGCRMTGGGFGGCAIALVESDAAHRIAREISEAYEKKSHRQATIFCSDAAGGAHLLK